MQKTKLIVIWLLTFSRLLCEQVNTLQAPKDIDSIPPIRVKDIDARVTSPKMKISGMQGLVWMIGPKSGLAAEDEGFERLLDRVDRTLANNPYLEGIYIINHWDLIEPEEGKFQFHRLDQIIALAHKYCIPYKLSLNPGIYCPEWIYEKGAIAFHTKGSNPARKNIYKKAIKIPIPWDPVFKTTYFNALNKLEERYGNDPYFIAIALTVSTFMSPEWHLPSSSKDMKQWAQIPDYKKKLETAWKDGIRRFASIFSKQQLILEASSYPLSKKIGNAVVEMGVGEYPGRFTVQINQLMGRVDMIDRPPLDKLIVFKEKYGDNICIGIQNLRGWEHEKIAKEQGSMELSVYNFIQSGAVYWELWHGDGMNVETCKRLTDLIAKARLHGLKCLKKEAQN